ncbi:MAG: hypothetical protein HMLKMBBP_03859 [Planctomycetes bacterium]|nr:hypothetical protein [Planctomycetota bacterium]
MAVVLGDGSSRSQSTRLGNALVNARDRVFANWKIESAGRDSHTKAALYRLTPAADVGAQPAGESAPAPRAVSDAAPGVLPSLADFEEAP